MRHAGLDPSTAMRLQQRSTGKQGRPPGWIGKRAWTQLDRAFTAGDSTGRTTVYAIARDPSHGCASKAKALIANEWFRTRDEKLLDIIIETRARGTSGPARLATAALIGDLATTWTIGDQTWLSKLALDTDPRLAHAVRAALINVGPDQADPRAQTASTLLADLWIETRDPDLRGAVVATRGIARDAYGRLVTLCLHQSLSTSSWIPQDNDLRKLLIDDDPDVGAGVREAITCARGETCDALWAIGLNWAKLDQESSAATQWWENSLTQLLMTSDTPPPAYIINALWLAWLTLADPALIARLHAWALVATTNESDADVASLIETSLATKVRVPNTDGLFRLATRVGHPIAHRATSFISDGDDDLLNSFCQLAISDQNVRAACIGGRLAPRDHVGRATWFLLTNQTEEYRAFDADGSLLALAYTSASEEDRQRLQEAMRTAGGLDLVRILVGADRRGRIQTMTPEEVDYLAETLAGRDEWNRLWGIVLDLPLARAVSLMRHFTADRWQPADDDSRDLYATFLAAREDKVQRALTHIRDSWPLGVHQARIHFKGPINDVSFAPDAPILAVAGSQQSAGLIDLRQGRLTHRFDGFRSSIGRVLHVGNATFLAAERTNSTANPCTLYVANASSPGPGSWRPIVSVMGSITSLDSRGGRGYIAGTRSGHILLSDDVEEDPVDISVTAFGLDRFTEWPREVACSPDSDAFALLSRRLVIATDRPRRVLAGGSNSAVIQRAVFAGSNILAVGSQSGEVQLMRMQGGNLAPTYSCTNRGLGGLAAVPERSQVLVADYYGANVHVYSGNTLDHIGSITNERWGTARSVNVSANGDLLAVGCSEGFTDIYDLRVGAIPTLVAQPMVTMVPNDIGRLSTAVESAPSAAVSNALSLLLSALHHRFRFDIELGDTGMLKAGDYDISLG